MSDTSTPQQRVQNPPQERPLVVFDGDCGYCRRWVARGRGLLGDRVDFAPSQSVAADFPEISAEAFEQGIQFIDVEGRVWKNAEAAFRALALRPGWAWPLGAYQRIPGVAPVTEACYRVVASHRMIFSRVERWLIGTGTAPLTYGLTRWLFLRALALVYLIAFLSFWVQAEALVGSNGILPMSETLERVRDVTGFNFPTLFWLNSSDACLHAVCAAGVVGSILVFAGIFAPASLLMLWILYLSLCTVGHAFMGFQWDNLLLEVGFLAIFFAPWQLRMSPAREASPSPVLLWLFRLLSFKLMWGSGLVKIASRDGTWWPDLTAMTFHYGTQPIPNPLSWFSHNMPYGFHRFETGATLFLELVIPFLIFAPRRLRRAGAAIMAGLQVLILITGNFACFNVLTLALLLLLLDDVVFPASWRRWWKNRQPSPRPAWIRWPRRLAVGGFALVYISISTTQIWGQFNGSLARYDHASSYSGSRPVIWTYQMIRPFRSINSYGLFARMTTTRPEIIVQGSNDGTEWHDYEFRYKPGDLHRRPPQIAPHQPRLDWQMWFAALGNLERPHSRYWFFQFLECLLEDSEEVLALLETNPFPDQPPRYVRALAYDYTFTDPATRADTGAWWARTNRRVICPPTSLKDNP